MSHRKRVTRRDFLKKAGVCAAGAGAATLVSSCGHLAPRRGNAGGKAPNLLFVFADQLRTQSMGCMGNRQVITPNFDRLTAEGACFTNAISGFPVCSPYRASMLTGRYPQTTGMWCNSIKLPESERTFGEILKDKGYQTAYIGKWHLDGWVNDGWVPPGPARHGFDFWAGHNCLHKYMRAFYYRDKHEPIPIAGYEPDFQTQLAVDYLRAHDKDKPFCLFLSWAPPHSPYNELPDDDRAVYDSVELTPPPNFKDDSLENFKGYHAHITALDRNMGHLMATLEENGLAENTVVVFTSDHGDQLGSHGFYDKQRPYDESIRVPFLLRYPKKIPAGTRTDTILDGPDVLPTLLALMGHDIPDQVEGMDLSHAALDRPGPEPTSAFIMNILPQGQPFIEGLREWRGVRTKRHTYVRVRKDGWLLFDNEKDPCQLNNLIDDPSSSELREDLEKELQGWLRKTNDKFLPYEEYLARLDVQTQEWWRQRAENPNAVPRTP